MTHFFAYSLFPSTSGLGTSITNYEGPAFLSSSPNNFEPSTLNTQDLSKSHGSADNRRRQLKRPTAGQTEEMMDAGGYVPPLIPPHHPGWKWWGYRQNVLSGSEMLDQLLHEQRYDRRQRPFLTNGEATKVNFTALFMSMTKLDDDSVATVSSILLFYRQNPLIRSLEISGLQWVVSKN